MVPLTQESSAALERLLAAGAQRFSHSDGEADALANTYALTLQLALRGAALRNRRAAMQIARLRCHNASMRAVVDKYRVWPDSCE